MHTGRIRRTGTHRRVWPFHFPYTVEPPSPKTTLPVYRMHADRISRKWASENTHATLYYLIIIPENMCTLQKLGSYSWRCAARG